MRGRRPEPDHRFTFHGSWKRAEHDADGRRSFAAVERSMSDRLLARIIHEGSSQKRADAKRDGHSET